MQREGKIFYIQLEKKVTDFAGGNYSGKDTLPMSVFDQREVAKLEPFRAVSTLRLRVRALLDG